MAGKILTLVPQRLLDFDNTGGGVVSTLTLAQGVDVSGWQEVTLLVRVFSLNLTGNIIIYAVANGRTSESPGTNFLSSDQLGAFTLTGSTQAPVHFIQSLGPRTGPMISIIAQGTGASSANNALVNVELSLKTA